LATQRLDDLISGAEPPPVIRTMRLGTLDAWGEGWARKTWQSTPDMLNADGSLFGGLIAALADQIMAFAAMTVVPQDSFFRTANLSISYFKLAKAGALHVEGRIISQTRQMIHVRADFRDADGNLLSESTAQQILQKFK